MRCALLVVAALPIASEALSMPPGVPDPVASTIALSAPTFPCHYWFRTDGGLDDLTVTVTVVDFFGAVVPGCAVTVTLVPMGPATPAFCVCAPCNPQVAVTAPITGVAVVTFSKIGGRGLLGISVEACGVVLGGAAISFTSPDLNGSCEALPLSATGIVDLGIWASALAVYNLYSDYNCSDLPITIADLGVWAGGLGLGCDGLCP